MLMPLRDIRFINLIYFGHAGWSLLERQVYPRAMQTSLHLFILAVLYILYLVEFLSVSACVGAL